MVTTITTTGNTTKTTGTTTENTGTTTKTTGTKTTGTKTMGTKTMNTVRLNLTLLFQTLCLVMLVSIANGSNCDTPRDIKDATYEYKGLKLPNGKYKNGANVTYTCGVGFTKGKDSSGTFTCLDGKWTGDADKLRCCKSQICIDPDLFCVLPHVSGASPDIVAGDESFSIDNQKTAYGVGTGVKFNCENDYFLESGSTVGPFECIHGGQWSPKISTICRQKECGPPPTIENSYSEKVIGWESTNKIGTQYKYICNSGYEKVLLDTVRCESDLTWRTTVGFGPSYVQLDFPQCIKKQPTSSSSDIDFYNTIAKKKPERTTVKYVVITMTLAFVMIIFAIIIFRYMRRGCRESSRTRAIIVNGIATTEYVPPTNYTGPPPTLTTGPVVFAPASAPPAPQGLSYPMQGGIDPMETYPLTSQSSKNDSFNLDAPPPPYNDAVYKST